MFVQFDPDKHAGKTLYTTQGRQEGDLIAEILIRAEVKRDAAAAAPRYYFVWEGEGEPPAQGEA